MAQIQTIPFELTSSVTTLWNYSHEKGELSATALPQTDIYCNPKDNSRGNGVAVANALTLLGDPGAKDFQLSAKLTVGFNSSYDAGALLIWQEDHRWAKFCFEFSPDREAMVVSVVTIGASDDANSFTLESHTTWLRISRMGFLYAFHSSEDGDVWKLIRVFTLGESIAEHRVGFVAQAPTGDGCEVSFSDIVFSYSTLGELRDGS
jgi:regulation of enolase protein 1 (concanavalin A-like superfamily)